MLACDKLGDIPPKPNGDSEPVDVQSALTQNRTKWISETISDYQFDCQWICFCVWESVKPVAISICENRIDSVIFVEEELPVAAEDFERYRTIEGLFDLI